MECAIAIIFSCVVVVSCSKCDPSVPLPKPSQMASIEKITGVWYQTVSSNDYISSQYICGTLSSVRVNSGTGSFKGLLTKYYSKAKPRSFKVNYRKGTDGYFEPAKVDQREIAAHDFDQYGRLNAKALEEESSLVMRSYYRINFQPRGNSLISDETNYIAYVSCTSEGWAVWIFTPQKVLNTEQLLYIHNELIKHGIHTELRLGNCENINPE